MMMGSPPPNITETLRRFHQEHIVQWWDELSDSQQQNLTAQIENVDFETITEVWQRSRDAESHDSGHETNRADLAKAPSAVVYQPESGEDQAARRSSQELGEQLLSDGRVAVITVAGGQGSRLGFDHPKGMYPIGPVSDRTLFQIFAEQILARQRRHDTTIPWLIMTSAATHQETVDFLTRNECFGLDRRHVHFFQQGSMPAVDAETGKLLLSDRDSLCLSPDGHGGLVTALKKSGLLQKMAEAGIEHFFYHQVDNPTVILCDPFLIGTHHHHQSELTTNVVRKASPTERMGVLVDIDGRVEIIEYSELNEEQASRHDDSGQWIFWAGNTAIHVFSRSFFESLTADGDRLELHLARKKVSHIDANGDHVEPSTPNANKFERFIFDALPLARNALIVEGDREREFNPVKNADGSDSPATAKAALNRIGHEWLSDAGHAVDDSVNVEISPLTALDALQLADRLKHGETSVDKLTG